MLLFRVPQPVDLGPLEVSKLLLIAMDQSADVDTSQPATFMRSLNSIFNVTDEMDP
jgi:hypothetical protein